MIANPLPFVLTLAFDDLIYKCCTRGRRPARFVVCVPPDVVDALGDRFETIGEVQRFKGVPTRFEVRRTETTAPHFDAEVVLLQNDGLELTKWITGEALVST